MPVALVDGNNFYISCERVFNPKLRGVPIVVLGNNDGIIVSRSAEAKSLGIKMGYPAFMIRDLMRKHQVRALSSNYGLYADMSRRMMDVLATFSQETEVYSIDESFLNLDGMAHVDLVAYCQRIRATVAQWTGLPVCAGIGHTKTLAKLANHVAKKRPELNGVCDFTQPHIRAACFPHLPISEVWGIGPAAVKRLVALGIESVEELSRMDVRHARQTLTVVGERIVRELNGVSCLSIEAIVPARKGTACTRNFSHAITEFDQMREAVASFATRVAEKLREQRQVAENLTVFMHTNLYNGDAQYSNSLNVRFPEATADALEFVSNATWAANRIWRSGFRYSKAGVICDGLVSAESSQRSLLQPSNPGRARLMQAIDRINERMGRGTVRPLSLGIRPTWKTKFGNRSPSYTTNWNDVPVVRCS